MFEDTNPAEAMLAAYTQKQPKSQVAERVDAEEFEGSDYKFNLDLAYTGKKTVAGLAAFEQHAFTNLG
jgi:hypothetical protein